MTFCALMLFWVSSCGKKASTSSSAGQELLPDKVHKAAAIAATLKDISGLSFAMMSDPNRLAYVLRDGEMFLQRAFVRASSAKTVACLIIHENYHFNHYDEGIEENANIAGRECSLALGLK